MAKRFFLHTAALTGSKLAVTISQVLILPIIAAYLTVEDFGAVALAMTVAIFAQLLSDAGVGRSLIRQKQIIDREWNTVFWFVALVGALLMAALIGIAPLAAWIFDVPITGPLIAALSVVPFLFALTAVPAARMERDGHFPQLALIQLIAAVCGMAIAIWFAVQGAGAWALIGQQITIALVRFLGVVVASNYTYGLPLKFVSITNHMKFGRDSISTSLMFTAQRQVPIMMIGYFLGQTALGLYSMGQRIWNIPHMAITGPVSQTAYLRMTKLQDQPGAMAEVFVTMTRVLAFLVFPPMLIMAAVAPDIFAFLLSEPWRLAGAVYALAAFGIALECVVSTSGPMFQAADKSFIRVQMTTERSILRIIVIGCALPFGILAVGAAISLFAAAYLLRELAYARKADVFSRRTVLMALAPAIAVSLAGAGLLYLWTTIQGDVSGLYLIGQALAVLAAAWTVLLVLQFKTLKGGLAILGK